MPRTSQSARDPAAAVGADASDGPGPRAQADVRHIAVLVFPGFQIQDLAGPLAAFEMAAKVAGGRR